MPKMEIPNKPFAFIWFAIKPYQKWFWFAVVFASLSQVFAGLQSYTYKGFIDSANSFSAGAHSINLVLFWALAYPALLLASAGVIRGAGFMMNYLTVYIRTRAVEVLFAYLSLHSMSYFNDRFSGSLSEKANTVSTNVSRLTDQFIWSILGVFITYIITGFIIFSADKNLAILFFVGIFVLIPVNLFLTRKQKYLSEKLAELRAILRGQIIDVMTNISAVQQYVRRDHEIKRLSQSIISYRDADVRSDNFRERVLLLNNILVSIFVGIIVFWSFKLWVVEEITLGSFIMVSALTRGFMYSLTFVGQNLNNIMEIYGETRNGLKEIVVPHDIIDQENVTRLSVAQRVVEFDNVGFAYDKVQNRIFNNLTLKIKSGQKVGIVGTSGAGKSTLMKLLLRQYDVNEGSIKIDGQDIREVTQESLREAISIVPQEPMLFHRTIRENIMYGKLDATEEEMIEVAKKAHAHDFIEALPNKYDSLVGERGVKLSVGQRQRIAIARAFLKNAPILILDEATSALDSESEVAVQKALQNLMEGKTVFAIAHRLSTLREMDRILVFKDGQVVEDGTHRTLAKKEGGVYASLWSHQAGGFLKEE